MEEALTALLLAYPALTALVGDRVHWLRLPPTVHGYPYVNLQVVARPHDYHYGGKSNLEATRVQIDVWAESKEAQVATARAVSDCLSGYRGTVAGVNFRGIFLISDQEMPSDTTGEERQLFRRSVDFNISWFSEV